MIKGDEVDLVNRIKQLEEENKLLKKGILNFYDKGKSVSVPEDFKPIFDEAEKTVGEYFEGLEMNPSLGTIKIRDQRYVLMRAESLSVGFLTKIKNLYADKGEDEAYRIGRKLLFDLAHVVGEEDAHSFQDKMGLTDPISKLSAGPVHFAYSGWAFVDILPESRPSPDENFYLKYNHPYSFEADSWLSQGKKSTFPVCIMSAGYSAGWCEESFGIPLTSVELTCRAKGDDSCTFIMAPPEKMEEYLKNDPNYSSNPEEYEIPLFFERKKAEDKIINSLREKNILLQEVHHRVKNNLQLISSFLSLQSHYLPDDVTADIFEEAKNRIKALALVHDKLHLDTGVQHVDMDNYLNSILVLLSESYRDKIEIEGLFNCETNETFHIDKAVPCGLIINELVSNSIKHAFIQDQKDKKIAVKFHEIEGHCKISVSDNGKGFPIDFNIEDSDSLGLEIINALTGQLNGTLEYYNKEGAEFVVKFDVTPVTASLFDQ